MKQQMQDINDDVADKIRYHAEFLKKEIAETDGQMEKIVFTTKFDKKKVFVYLLIRTFYDFSFFSVSKYTHWRISKYLPQTL